MANLDGAAQKQRAILTQMVRKAVEGRFDGQSKATDKPPEMGFMSTKEFFAKNWEGVKAKNGSGASVLEVSIIPLRNNRLVATLWDPSNPGTRKTFTGPAPDVDMGQNSVELRAANDSDKADFARAASGQPPEEAPKSWSEAFKKSASRNSGTSSLGGNGGTGGAKTSSLSVSTLKGASLLDDKNSSGSKGDVGPLVRIPAHIEQLPASLRRIEDVFEGALAHSVEVVVPDSEKVGAVPA